MQISVRSYLTAGTVAVVGAGAIALAPIVPSTSPAAIALPTPAIAEVSLTALSLSLNDVLGLLQNFGIGGTLPDILTALPSLLPTDLINAVVTEFVTQAGPLVTVAATEVFGFLGTAVTGLLTGPDSIPARFGEALAAIPAVLVSAIGSLSTGDIATALATITAGLAAPASGISQAIADATAAFQDFVTTQVNGLITVLPGVLFSAVQTVIGNNLQAIIDSVGTAISGLFGGLIPAAAAVSAAASVPAPNGALLRSSAVVPAAAAAAPVAVAPAVQPAESAAPADLDLTPAPSAEREQTSVKSRSRSSQIKPAAAVADVNSATAEPSAPSTPRATGKAGAVRAAAKAAAE
jgi:hypothetical protein